MCYVARTWQLNDLHNSTVAIPWQLPHLLHNRNYSKTRPLKLRSFSDYSFSLYRPDSSYSLSSFFFSFSGMNYSTIDYNLLIQYGRENKSLKEEEEKSRKEYISYKKAVMAFLLGKLEQLFYLAHSFVFFLGKIQILEQQ